MFYSVATNAPFIGRFKKGVETSVHISEFAVVRILAENSAPQPVGRAIPLLVPAESTFLGYLTFLFYLLNCCSPHAVGTVVCHMFQGLPLPRKLVPKPNLRTVTVTFVRERV